MNDFYVYLAILFAVILSYISIWKMAKKYYKTKTYNKVSEILDTSSGKIIFDANGDDNVVLLANERFKDFVANEVPIVSFELEVKK